MDITTRCNIRCIMCPVPRKKEKLDISETLLDKIHDEVFPLARSVVLSCDYEPLVSERLPYLLGKLSKNDSFSKTLFTNGTLLSENISKMILNAAVDKLIISVHAADRGLYESISRGASFDKLINNIETFLTIREKGAYEQTHLEFVMTVLKRNIHRIPDVVRLASSFGIRKLALRRVCGCPEESIENSHDEIKEYFSQALKIAREKNMLLDYPPEFKILLNPEEYSEREEAAMIPEFCEAKEGIIWISPAGVIKPCNNWAGAPIGNLGSESFMDIWKSSRYRKIRGALEAERLPDNCRLCHIYETLTAAGKLKR